MKLLRQWKLSALTYKGVGDEQRWVHTSSWRLVAKGCFVLPSRAQLSMAICPMISLQAANSFLAAAVPCWPPGMQSLGACLQG